MSQDPSSPRDSNADASSDSPLSTTANVLGILTFALGLLAYFLAFLTVTRSAESSLSEVLATLSETDKQILEIKSFLDDEEREADSDYAVMKGVINGPEESFRAAKSEFESLVRRVVDTQGRQREQGKERRMGVGKRLMWWYRERELMSATVRLESRRVHFATIQLVYVLRKLKSLDNHLTDVERSVGELKRELTRRNREAQGKEE